MLVLKKAKLTRASRFDPRVIPGLGLWLDAADAAAVSVSDAVDQWSDKSGNARHYTATTTARPTYTVDSFGRPVVRFDGSNDSMSGPLDGLSQNQGHIHLLAAVRYGIAGADRRSVFFSTANGSQNVRCMLRCVDTYRVGGRRLDNDTFAEVAGSAVDTANPVLQEGVFEYSSAILTQYINGTSDGTPANPFQTAGSTANTATLGVTVGSGGGAANLSGDLLEVLAFTTALIPAHWQQLRLYLFSKWSIAGTA